MSESNLELLRLHTSSAELAVAAANENLALWFLKKAKALFSSHCEEISAELSADLHKIWGESYAQLEYFDLAISDY